MNQALGDNGAATLFPTTVRALEKRNTMLRDLVTMPSATARPAYSALTLPGPVDGLPKGPRHRTTTGGRCRRRGRRGPGPSGRR